ncbi:MAG: hypothetical protein AB7G75_00375 [Candidatus Binatia bacterium]
MKRVKLSVLGFLVSFSLAFTSPTGAQLSNVSNATLDNNTSSTFSGEEIGHAVINVVFDGWNLSWQHVMNIAKDPVLSWGAVQDERGDWIQGEVWMIVVKGGKFIYFHLTDTPNSAKDTTSYNGYTVKIKAPMTINFYGFGYGGAVPLIGNDTDAFVVTTTEMLVNSAFTEGETQRLDARTGAEIDYLVHLYDTVQSYGLSSSGSRGSVAIQYFAPDGPELVEPFSQSWHESASSDASYSAYCDEVGDNTEDAIHFLTEVGEVVQDFTTIARAWVTGFIGGGTVQAVILHGTGLASAIGAKAMRRLVNNVGAPAAAALAKGVCESVTTRDVLPPIEFEANNSPDIDEETQWVYVCVDLAHAGETRTIWDNNGEGTVHHFTEDTCLEWDVQLQIA